MGGGPKALVGKPCVFSDLCLSLSLSVSHLPAQCGLVQRGAPRRPHVDVEPRLQDHAHDLAATKKLR